MLSLNLLFAQFEQAERMGLMTAKEVRDNKKALMDLNKLLNKRKERKKNEKLNSSTK